jgi:hypothetical protein
MVQSRSAQRCVHDRLNWNCASVLRGAVLRGAAHSVHQILNSNHDHTVLPTLIVTVKLNVGYLKLSFWI